MPVEATDSIRQPGMSEASLVEALRPLSRDWGVLRAGLLDYLQALGDHLELLTVGLGDLVDRG